MNTAFMLQTRVFSGWAMLGSNQRPLPCEGGSITSWLFAIVQKYLQNRTFVAGCIRSSSWCPTHLFFRYAPLLDSRA